MTTMNTCSVLLVAVAAAVICTSAPSPAPADPDPYPCPWRTWPHPEDPFIQKLGRWVVEQEHVMIGFEKVESAKLQGIGSCTTMTHNYYYELIIVADIRGIPGTPGGVDEEKYRVVVYVVNFTQPQKVMSFEHNPPAAN